MLGIFRKMKRLYIMKEKKHSYYNDVSFEGANANA